MQAFNCLNGLNYIRNFFYFYSYVIKDIPYSTYKGFVTSVG